MRFLQACRGWEEHRQAQPIQELSVIYMYNAYLYCVTVQSCTTSYGVLLLQPSDNPNRWEYSYRLPRLASNHALTAPLCTPTSLLISCTISFEGYVVPLVYICSRDSCWRVVMACLRLDAFRSFTSAHQEQS